LDEKQFMWALSKKRTLSGLNLKKIAFIVKGNMDAGPGEQR